MCVAIVHNQKNITPYHPCIKPFQPLEKDDLCHPGLRVASILATKTVSIDVFEATRVFIFANDKKWKLVRAISIATHSRRETFLVLFASFKLLCCQGIEMSCVSENKSMVWQWAYNIMLHLPAFCKTIQFHPCCRCHATHTDPKSNESAASSFQSQPCWLIQTPQSDGRT